MDIDALFAGMAKADVYGRGGRTEPGLYIVETKNILTKKGTNPKKPGDSFICEFTFVESSNPAHAPGASSSWVVKLSWPSALASVTKFVYALLGWELTDANLKNEGMRVIAERYARAMCGSEKAKAELAADPNTPWIDGMMLKQKLRLETVLEDTSTPGGKFTAHKWAPITESAATESATAA